MNSIHFSFEDLKVYQKALDFVDDVYEPCKEFPKEETYRHTSQCIRASTSIALDIAESAGDTNARFNRFLQIAIGSIKESFVCITIAQRQAYISSDKELKLKQRLVEL